MCHLSSLQSDAELNTNKKMVTSNKVPEKKVVKMTEQNNSAVVPQRTLLGEVNEHITCPLCHGYYIDATTIVECLHSFCRSCIIKHLQAKSYCPVCEMMINSAKPNIKPDKALQDIVYKLVPGLFQKEMERRQQFYSSRPGPAASTTPEQRGEDTERIIFSPEDVISFSLEYSDATDTDSISSKSSDSNEAQPTSATSRRYLQCPAVVNISHLKKFLSMKFDIDSAQYAIDILYKRVPLPDYYTLMDIAYIFNWKRNEPMRFFYQIIDYVAIRNRLFDINRKGTHFHDRKSSPASTEDTNMSSPAPTLNDQGSEASSGTDSPMPGDSNTKTMSDSTPADKNVQQSKPSNNQDLKCQSKSSVPTKKCNEDVEKSQFLNSFELTAKSNTPVKSSPSKANEISPANVIDSKVQNTSPKSDESLKRKQQPSLVLPEKKKLKIELEKTKIPTSINLSGATSTSIKEKSDDGSGKSKESPKLPSALSSNISGAPSSTFSNKSHTSVSKPSSDSTGAKRPVPLPQNLGSPKKKPNESPSYTSSSQKTVSPLKLQIPKIETPSISKNSDVQKPNLKKMPDLKPSSQMGQNKGQSISKVRMDLLANNSDPTIDRSKIMSTLSTQSTAQGSGDPLKSLFDSCKINIPSSLSITLTDQKLDARNPVEASNTDQKKAVVNKNLVAASNISSHKVPSPPVHNYIEILKLPESDPKKQSKPEGTTDVKPNVPNKNEGNSTPTTKAPTKSTETSAKGPVPNLKPISDTKLGKQSGNFVSPITFQQQFEQQIQTLQSDKKPKPKNKAQVPKLVPATPKSFSNAIKLNNPISAAKPSTTVPNIDSKSAALDLSTPHNMQTLSPQQSKTFESMQNKALEIANLAKKQNLPLKATSQNISSNFHPAMNPLRVPSTGNSQPSGSNIHQSSRQETVTKPNQVKSNPGLSMLSSANYQIPSLLSPGLTQSSPSPRSQTRSPSSSPKLVIAEEKQTSSPSEHINQSNQITNTQLPNVNLSKPDYVKPSPGPSKPGLRPIANTKMGSSPASGKVPGTRHPITPTIRPTNPTSTEIQCITAQQALLRRQFELSAWNIAHRLDMFKNMANISHQSHNKDK